uniref:receptor protein serine/threonine kinase n=1 Tax=Anoplophora glabripennis TaxID=217634 RepID=V5G000_ANOGL
MAPEILDKKIDLQNFEAHKSADMYACGLVFWEITRRCDIGDCPTPPYAPPFRDEVPRNPSLEQMHEVVCVKEIRPVISESWKNVEILETLAKTMEVSNFFKY